MATLVKAFRLSPAGAAQTLRCHLHRNIPSESVPGAASTVVLSSFPRGTLRSVTTTSSLSTVTVDDGEVFPLLSHHRGGIGIESFRYSPPLVSLSGVLVGDATGAAEAAQHARNGRAMVYRGDYRNARQLLTALTRRVSGVGGRKKGKGRRRPAGRTSPVCGSGGRAREEWESYRRLVREGAMASNLLMVEVDGGDGHSLAGTCRRAPPDVGEALRFLFDTSGGDDDGGERGRNKERKFLMSLREILGAIGARQWRERGIYVPLLGETIHPHHGVFAPIRQEYLAFFDGKTVPPPECASRKKGNAGTARGREEVVALDVGTGTGVLAALMLRNGWVDRVVGTDVNPRAVDCATENLKRLALADRATFACGAMFPLSDVVPDAANVFDLIVCNPPWIPGPADSWLDRAVYDDGSAFLSDFLGGAAGRLKERRDAEVWLVMSNLAELLGLRTEDELCDAIDEGGLEVTAVHCVKPSHPRARKAGSIDVLTEAFPLIAVARAAEVTKLYRLRRK